MPWPLDDGKPVASAELLDVIFEENFKIDMHVSFVLNHCNQPLY